jgi:hypothetical protein
MGEPWEYKIVYFSTEQWTSTGLPSDLNEQFDIFGAEGWELVSTHSIAGRGWFSWTGKTVGAVAYFKRRLIG